MDSTVLSENLNKSLINLQTHNNKVHKEIIKKKDYIKSKILVLNSIFIE